MMMRSLRILAILFLTLFSGPLAAEPVIIRTGEHAGFTRVVLEFIERPEWRAGRTKSGYEIRLVSESRLEFDTSRAFRLIGRERIGDLVTTEDGFGLRIDLVCDCAAEISELAGNLIVADIRPGPAGRWARHEAEITPALSREPELWPAHKPIENIQFMAGTLEARVGIDLDEMPLDQPQFSTTLSDFVEASMPGDAAGYAIFDVGEIRTEVPGESNVGRFGSSIEALGREFSRAVSQGLVEPADFPLTDKDLTGSFGADLAASRNNVRARTVFDRDVLPGESPLEITDAGVQCIVGEEIDVLGWSSYETNFGDLRRNVISQDGRVDEAAALKLARYYISQGFGAEAILASSLLPDNNSKRILIALGEILDESESARSVLQGQLVCPGPVALWALLAVPARNVDLPRSTDNILETFSGLPRHIRTHLGPLLSERFRQAGEANDARMALNAVTRVGGGSRQQDLTSARLGLLGTNAEDARQELRRLTQSTDITAAEALLELLIDARLRDVPPDNAWVDDAPSLIRATRGTPVAERLVAEYLRGQVPLKQYDRLRRSMSSDLPGLSGEIMRELAVAALHDAAINAEDAEFLRAEVGFSRYVAPDEFETGPQLDIALRLLNLGLSERALDYLPERPIDSERTAVSARILVANREAEKALEISEGLSNTDDLLARAAALDFLGRSGEAARIYAEVGADEVAAQRALQAGDLDWLSSEGRTELTDAIAVLKTPASEDSAARTLTSLADHAKGRRHAAIDILERTRVSAIDKIHGFERIGD